MPGEKAKYPYLEVDLRDSEGPSDIVMSAIPENVLGIVERLSSSISLHSTLHFKWIYRGNEDAMEYSYRDREEGYLCLRIRNKIRY